jgi:tetratricopeptide (TPR) repeat protein
MAEWIECEAALDPKRNRQSLWKRARERLLGEVWPTVTPSFQMLPGAAVFTIGSCFARNIEEHLSRLGFRIPTLALKVPREEWRSRPNGIINKYTPAAIFQEIDWAKKIFLNGGKIAESDSSPFLYERADGSCVDTNLAGFNPVTRERFFERREQIYDIFKKAFGSDYVVITLGLIEAWFDREKRIFIQETPQKLGKDFARNPSRFAFQTLGYAQCHDLIQTTIDSIRSINREARFLITTSPVPLSRTFTDKDVILANTYSKSLLRTVAGDIAAANENVDYFPSYESVMLTKSWNIWEPDLLHVTDAFVGKVVARLTDVYCSGLKEADKTFLHSYIDLKDQSLASALELARQAVEASPNSGQVRKHYGSLLAQKGDVKEAELQYEKAIAFSPSDAALHYQLSAVLAGQGRLDEAIRAAYRSTTLEPDNQWFHRHFARLWLKKWKLGRATVQFVLASSHHHLIKTKRRGVKRLIRFLLSRLEKTSHLTHSGSQA